MHITSKSTIESLTHLCQLLDTNRKVYYSRFGDGQIQCISGNKDEFHDGSPFLAHELKKSFDINHKLYLRAVGINYPIEANMIHGVFAPHSDNFPLEEKLILNCGEIEGFCFESPILFHYYGIFKPLEFNSFLDRYIRPKRKMFIGSLEKTVVEKLYGPIDYYIQIPPKNAYYTMDKWFPKVLEYATKVDVILPSAGMASNVINYRLWEAGIEAHVLDIGSIVDAVHGMGTRKWIKLLGHRVNNVLVPKSRNNSILFKINYLKKEIWYGLRLLWKGRNHNIPYSNIRINAKNI